jgi:soluble lytic murein transglycosylase
MVKLTFFIGLIAAICLQMTYLFAEEKKAINNHDRYHYFTQAKEALQNGNRSKYLLMRNSLRSYPLFPYLWYLDLKNRLSNVSYIEIADFLRIHSHSPLAKKLQYHWLASLATQKQWSLFLSAFKQFGFKPTINTDRAIYCLYLQSQLATKPTISFDKKIMDLWLVGYSQPSACDPLFSYLKEQNKLTSSLVWSRIWLSLHQKNERLVNHLRDFLPKSHRHLLTHIQKVYQNPKKINRAIKDIHQFWAQQQTRPMIVMAVIRLSDLNYPSKAVTLLSQAKKHVSFTQQQQQMMYRAIGVGFARNTGPFARYWLNKVSSEYADKLVHLWRLRINLLEKRWGSILTDIDAMSTIQQQKPIWIYWRGRALHELGHTSKAKQQWYRIINIPTYYGLLARNALRLPPLSLTNKHVSREDVIAISKRPGLLRAYLFLQNKQIALARAEWNAAIVGLNQRELHIAAYLAYQWGWYWTAIKTVVKANQAHDATIRFPILYRDLIKEKAIYYQVPAAWIFAVIRQESAYQNHRTSSAGARGIMQIMPKTGKMLAKQQKTSTDLWDINVNVTLGSAYLKKLLAQFDDWILATIAYNAGPTRLSIWLKSHQTLPSLPFDALIECLPWFETRNYIKNVVYFATMYQQRLGVNTPLLALPNVMRNKGDLYEQATSNNVFKRLSTSRVSN